ncbi:MAG TPA: serine protease, partial [Verrucomicrobiaceae bacterium]
AGKLLNNDQVAAAMRPPQAVSIQLPQPNTKRLEPREIAARARKALVRVGWFYLCPRCDQLHVNLSGGYAITADGVVATCWHVVAPEKQDMINGHIIASDADGNLMPVSAVLGFDRELDTAIVRVSPGRKLTPLPLNDQSRAGDAAFVLSDPLEYAGYFSGGIINRYYWREGVAQRDADSLAAARSLRMNVSTDWAPGSSGAAVLDGCGNVIGHVAVINALSEDKPSRQGGNQEGKVGVSRAKETMIVLHEAITARGVKLLLEAMKQAF